MDTNPFKEILKNIKVVNGLEALDTDTPSPTCRECDDTGWIPKDQIINGDKIRCSVPCKCRAQRFLELCWKASGISVGDRDKTFTNFRRLAGTEGAYQAAWELAQPNSKLRLVVVYGGPGNGKTHLGLAVAIESIQCGIAAWVIRCADWLEDIKRCYGVNDFAGADIIRGSAEKVPVLVFDELKWKTSTDEDWVDNLITKREQKGLKTYVTTNYNWEDLLDKFGRVVSRAKSKSTGRLILNEGEDQRGKLA